MVKVMQRFRLAGGASGAGSDEDSVADDASSSTLREPTPRRNGSPRLSPTVDESEEFEKAIARKRQIRKVCVCMGMQCSHLTANTPLECPLGFTKPSAISLPSPGGVHVILSPLRAQGALPPPKPQPEAHTGVGDT